MSRETLPDGSVNVWAYLTKDGRDQVRLGKNHDGSDSTLPPYIDIDGIQIHPERLEQYFQQLLDLEKKTTPGSDNELYGVLAILRHYLGS